MRSMPRVAFALTFALFAGLVLSAPANAEPRAFTQVLTVEEAFGSGSCSGETVDFIGTYHELVHYQLDDAGNVVRFNVMTGESNFGVGIGEESGDRYVRVYHQNAVSSYDYDPYTESVLGTYLTRVLHLGPDDDVLGDMWIRSAVRYTWTPDGYVRVTESFATECS